MSQQAFWDRWTDHKPDDLKAARRKGKKPAVPDRMPDVPCCGRCANWIGPADGDDFGQCRKAVVVIGPRIPRGFDVGTLVALDEIGPNQLIGPSELMRVRDWAPACSRFASADRAVAA